MNWRTGLERLAAIWSALGAHGLQRAAARGWRRCRERRVYQAWLRRQLSPAVGPVGVRVDGSGPLISVLMPTYQPDLRWLRRAVDSVRAQCYGRWELCIADDASQGAQARECLESIGRADSRIRLDCRLNRGHISAASNTALSACRGAYVALLDQDDELRPDALARVAGAVQRHPEVDLVYSDEDKVDARGRRRDPYLKPDWSPDLVLSQNVVSHLSVFPTERVRAVGGFREGLEGSQDHDLVLRVMELPGARAHHLAEVLYHWRLTPGSTSSGIDRKSYAVTAGVRAIESHLERMGRPARVDRALVSYYRVRWRLPPGPLTVAVITEGPGPGPASAAFTLGEAPSSLEVHLACAADQASRARGLDQAARAASGDVLVFLGRGCRLAPGGLEELVSQALRPEVGVVGGAVVSPGNRVVHGGYLVDLDPVPRVLSAHAGLDADEPGHFGRNRLVQNLSAVSAEVLATRREVFESLGGFDALRFPEELFDVDLCMRARAQGLRVVWTPWARAWSSRSPSRRPRLPQAELDRLQGVWSQRWPTDPYWHPGLGREAGDYRLAREGTGRPPLDPVW